jgi:hypothetical protein
MMRLAIIMAKLLLESDAYLLCVITSRWLHEDVQLGKGALVICTTCGGYKDSTGDE